LNRLKKKSIWELSEMFEILEIRSDGTVKCFLPKKGVVYDKCDTKYGVQAS